MRYNKVYLDAFGYELPPHEVSSTEIEERLRPLYERLKLPAGRLELMSGIKTRRFWDEGSRPSDGAVMAARKALEKSACRPADIDCLIFTAVCRDMMEPATASFVHDRLGLPADCLIFDISNACLGFLDGMVTVANMLELGQIKRALVVSSETAEDLVSSTINHLLRSKELTRRGIKPSFASLTIGSGAVALVMSAAEGREGPLRLVGGAYRCDTANSGLCKGGANAASEVLMATDSENLLERGVACAHAAWGGFLKEVEWGMEEIDKFFCHQVGRAHAALLFERLGLPMDKNFQTLEYLGNVGSVSAPITLALALDKGAFARGRGAILGIGSGINTMMLGVER